MDIPELSKLTAARLDLDLEHVRTILDAANTIMREDVEEREAKAKAAMDRIGQAIHDAFCGCGANQPEDHVAGEGDAVDAEVVEEEQAVEDVELPDEEDTGGAYTRKPSDVAGGAILDDQGKRDHDTERGETVAASI